MIAKKLTLTLLTITALVTLSGCTTPEKPAQIDSAEIGCTDPPGEVEEACVFTLEIEDYGTCTFVAVQYNDYREGGAGVTLVGCQ